MMKEDATILVGRQRNVEFERLLRIVAIDISTRVGRRHCPQAATHQ